MEKKKNLEKFYCMWDYCSLQMSCTVYIAKRKKIPRVPKSKKQERSFYVNITIVHEKVMLIKSVPMSNAK